MRWAPGWWTGTRSNLLLLTAFAVVAEVERAASTTNIFAGTLTPAADCVAVLLPLLPLLTRRRYPFGSALAVAALITLLGAGLHATIPFFGGLFPFLVVLYSASAWAAAPRQYAALAVPLALLGPMPLYISSFLVPGDYVFGLVASAFAWTAGQAVRRWRLQSIQLATALEEVRRSRDTATSLALAGERVRIARDVHDVVGNRLSVIVLQASAARLDNDESARALIAIEETGRQALADIRQVLGLLRRGDVAEPGPVPGFAALPTLVAQFAEAGLTVEVCSEGEPFVLPETLDVTAYRLLQEALTNALRHGGGWARLSMAYQRDQVTLRLLNDMRMGDGDLSFAGLPRGGHGIVGMRERAALVGGSCAAGPDGAGRFITEVVLPLAHPVSLPKVPS